MANPTTNYGFVLPTPTDLVTDLPADFDVALQGVDTRLKALQPGTTLGDIAYSSATANTNTRLGIGSTGQVLTVAGGVPSWATSSSGGMTLLSTTTLSGASVTISSINQTYNSLLMVISGVTNATADGEFRCAPNGTTSITSTVGPGGTATEIGQNANSYLLFAKAFPLNRADANNAWVAQIFNYSSATANKAVSVTGGYFQSGTNRGVFYNGRINTASAITSLVFDASGGNLSTGTVLLYGVK
jgi:hypothetical protein